jgi:hypothetical protein
MSQSSTVSLYKLVTESKKIQSENKVFTINPWLTDVAF